MKKIEVDCENIEDEIEDAEKYAELALDCKEEDPAGAEIYYQLANEEMNHMAMLHKKVVTTIEAYRKEKGEPPEGMKIMYNIFHKKHIAAAATVKGLLSLYKGEK